MGNIRTLPTENLKLLAKCRSSSLRGLEKF